MSLNTPARLPPDDPSFAKYAVILAGIVFSWAEVCLLDFKVLPTENFSGAFLKNDADLERDAAAVADDPTDGVVNVGGRRIGTGRFRRKRFKDADDSDAASTTSSLECGGDDNFHTPVESEEEEEEALRRHSNLEPSVCPGNRGIQKSNNILNPKIASVAMEASTHSSADYEALKAGE